MRLPVWLISVVLLTAACIGGAGPGQSGCQLSEVPNSSAEKAVPSSVAAVGDYVVVVGTGYVGSRAGAFAGQGKDGVWTPGAIHGYTRLLEIDDVAGFHGEAWAVGAIGTRAPAIVRWDGNAWSPATVGDPGPADDGLAGVVALSSRSAWAVGRHDVAIGSRTLIERWDGHSWKPVPSPNEGATSSALKDVAATEPDDGWAVGWFVEHGRYRTLAEHWDGTRWSVVPTPDPGGADALLSGVVARGHDDVWAVGWTTQDDGTLHPLVERWDGRAWNVVETPSSLGDAALSGIAATGTGVVVVGRQVAGSDIHPVALLEEDGAWTGVPVEVSDNSAWLTGVIVDAQRMIWAVGSRAPNNGLTSSLLVTGCSVSPPGTFADAGSTGAAASG